MTILEILFGFKSSDNSAPRPYLQAKFKYKDRYDLFYCLIDSGADFCTIPIAFAQSLGIDFTKKLASHEIKEEFGHFDFSDTKKYDSFVHKLIEDDVTIPGKIGCACGQGGTGFYHPVQIEIGEFKKEIIVFWINADVVPLIGRQGVLDNMDEVVFKHKEGKGFFRNKL